MRDRRAERARQQVVGALALNGGEMTGLDLSRITGIRFGRLYPVLDDLVDEGVVVVGPDHEVPGLRRYRWGASLPLRCGDVIGGFGGDMLDPCTLGAGHSGMHREPDGAQWSRDVSELVPLRDDPEDPSP